jgi:hypothetical protein
MVLAGPFFVTAVILGAAGVGKALRPGPAFRALAALGLRVPAWLVRVGGIGEVVVAVAAVVSGARALAGLVAASYVFFAVVAGAALWRPGARLASCGCFGADDAPPALVHFVLNVVAAAVALGAVVWPAGTLGQTLRHQPLNGVAFGAFVGLSAWLWYTAVTLLPRLELLRRPRTPGTHT